jgi:dolichol-phosphate hexosyltransferase
MNSTKASVAIDKPRPRKRPVAVSDMQLRDVNRVDKIKLSILMPVYNEETTVMQAIHDVLSGTYPCDIEVIVVNDGSTDRTAWLLSQVQDERLIVREQPTNQGKGAALRRAAAEASGTHILPFDADLEYDPEDIPKLLEPVMKGRCNVVYGSRLFGCNTVYQSYRYAIGNRLLTSLANVLFDSHISDLHTCFKLIPRSVLEQLSLRETRFGLDTEITALLLKQGVRPFQVPISYFSRSRAQGKKITWRDALSCIRILVRVRCSRTVPDLSGDTHYLGSHVTPRSEPYHSHSSTAPDGFASAEPPDADVAWRRADDQLLGIPLAPEGQVGQA